MKKRSKEQLYFMSRVLVWFAVNQHQIDEIDSMDGDKEFRHQVKKHLNLCQSYMLTIQKEFYKKMDLDHAEQVLDITRKIEPYTKSLIEEINLILNVD